MDTIQCTRVGGYLQTHILVGQEVQQLSSYCPLRATSCPIRIQVCKYSPTLQCTANKQFLTVTFLTSISLRLSSQHASWNLLLSSLLVVQSNFLNRNSEMAWYMMLN